MIPNHFEAAYFSDVFGQVYWITGLSGAGKTTIGKLLYRHFKKQNPNLVFLDGDMMREVFGNTSSSYSFEERFSLTMKYAKLCHLLANQGIDVICTTISMFDKCREWNRLHLKNYFEIYLKVPLNILKIRDQKQLYSGAMNNSISQVIGIDLPFEEPKNPDLVLENDGSQSPEELCKIILNNLPMETSSETR